MSAVIDKEILKQDILLGGNIKEFVPILQKMPTVEVAEILWELDGDELTEVLFLFTPDQQGQLASDFDFDTQYAIFQRADRRRFAEMFENMHSSVRADFFRNLDKREQVLLLPYLTKRIREDVISLSRYDPESAGGIMSTDFATVLENMTCASAIEKVRKDAPSKKMIYYVYVVDEDMRMKGFLTLKNLILADPNQLVRDVLHRDYIYAEVDEDRESVAKKVERYDLVAIPILNEQSQLAGIVTHDEALEVLRAEHTEDMEKFMGITPSSEESEYLEDSVWYHYRKRIIWLISLAALSIFSAVILHHYEGALAKMTILVLFMPMMAATGGNTGSQAATVVINALALGQVSMKDWLRIVYKESRIGLLLGLSLGLLAFGKVILLSSGAGDLPEMYSLSGFAGVVALALCIQVLSANLIGSGLPLLVRKLGGDPTVAASPAITTIVDITGLLIYFGMATLFFGL